MTGESLTRKTYSTGIAGNGSSPLALSHITEIVQDVTRMMRSGAVSCAIPKGSPQFSFRISLREAILFGEVSACARLSLKNTSRMANDWRS
jgi:hypothetical protein